MSGSGRARAVRADTTRKDEAAMFIKLLAHLLGDYATYAAPQVLLAKEGQRHPTELADLCGIRFAAMSEVREVSGGKVYATEAGCFARLRHAVRNGSFAV